MSTQLPSNKKFGVLMSAISCFGAYYFSRSPFPGEFYLALVLSVTLIILTIFLPEKLLPLNKAWAALGRMMGRVITPVSMGILFFLVFTPIALLTKAFNRDELRLKTYASGESFWLKRDHRFRPPSSYKNQF